MKNSIMFLFFAFALTMISCSSEECMECTGTLVNGDAGDITICDNEDGTTTRTNNIDNTVTTDSTTYAGGIAYIETLGLSCQ